MFLWISIFENPFEQILRLCSYILKSVLDYQNHEYFKSNNRELNRKRTSIYQNYSGNFRYLFHNVHEKGRCVWRPLEGPTHTFMWLSKNRIIICDLHWKKNPTSLPVVIFQTIKWFFDTTIFCNSVTLKVILKQLSFLRTNARALVEKCQNGVVDKSVICQVARFRQSLTRW